MREQDHECCGSGEFEVVESVRAGDWVRYVHYGRSLGARERVRG